MRSKNQKMFMTNIVIMVTANDFDELENNTEAIEAVAEKLLPLPGLPRIKPFGFFSIRRLKIMRLLESAFRP